VLQSDAGWEEYYDYIFPDETAAQPNLKLLAMAKKWKQTQEEEPSEQVPGTPGPVGGAMSEGSGSGTSRGGSERSGGGSEGSGAEQDSDQGPSGQQVPSRNLDSDTSSDSDSDMETSGD